MFKSINKVIKVYIYWDIVINSAWGLLGPVFAIFIVQKIAVGNLALGAEIAGFASLFYWMTKAILQIPIGHYLDRNHGEKDDFLFFVLGTFLTGLVPFGYLVSSLPWHLYVFQIIHAVGMSMVIPSSYAIFIRHIDKGREALECGIDSTFLGIGVGITGAIGGLMVASFGFQAIFILAGLFTIISGFLLFLIRKDMALTVSPLHEIPPSWPF
jgi:MFS family permease